MKLNWRLFIPFTMLFLAALACSPPMPSVIVAVRQVVADSDVPGRAYAQVVSTENPHKLEEDGVADAIVYQTDDYGQSWQPAQYDFPDEIPQQYPLNFSGETLYLDKQAIWEFPRSTFRYFFFDNRRSDDQPFLPSHGDKSNSVQGDKLYVALGTEGVLTATIAADGSFRDWHLSSNGIDALHSLPLTIQNADTILKVILVALLIPPLPLMHTCFLYGVWIYLLPRRTAMLAAIVTTLFLSLVAAVGTIVWLTDTNTDFYDVVAVISAICAAVGAGLTLYWSKAAKISPEMRKKLVIKAVWVSLYVPIGVASVFTLWWLIFAIFFRDLTFRWAYVRNIRQPVMSTPDGRHLYGVVERLVGESAGAVLIFSLISSVPAFLWTSLIIPPGQHWLLILLPVGLVALIVIVKPIRSFVVSSLPPLTEAQQGAVESQLRLGILVRDVSIAAVLWIVLTVGSTIALFLIQVSVSNWFFTLLQGGV